MEADCRTSHGSASRASIRPVLKVRLPCQKAAPPPPMNGCTNTSPANTAPTDRASSGTVIVHGLSCGR